MTPETPMADQQPVDRELEALGVVVQALKDLPAESRQRVLELAERFYARGRPYQTTRG